MNTKTYSHTEITWSAVPAGAGKLARAKIGRTISGLLKAAEKRGEITVSRSYGRVTGSFVLYHLTEEQLVVIKTEALRRSLCTPVSIDTAARMMAGV